MITEKEAKRKMVMMFVTSCTPTLFMLMIFINELTLQTVMLSFTIGFLLGISYLEGSMKMLKKRIRGEQGRVPAWNDEKIDELEERVRKLEEMKE